MAQVTKSQRRKRNLVLAGKKTSIALEDGFWSGVEEIAASRAITVSELIAVIDKARNHSNLCSSIRLFVLDYYRSLSHLREAKDSSKAEAKPILDIRRRDFISCSEWGSRVAARGAGAANGYARIDSVSARWSDQMQMMDYAFRR
jgi:predicted DNA-binding ribbon-helix-helix protein